jgi:hypothetical protein
MSEPTTAEICDCASTGPDAISTCQRVIRGRVEPPCDCDCHKPTREQKRADLARAMGWIVVQYRHIGIGTCWKLVNLPAEKERRGFDSEAEAWADVPDYFTSHAACHALVVWLATQGPVAIQRFVLAMSALTIEHRLSMSFEGWQILGYLTAEPAIKAEAAWRTINAAEQPKAS